MRPPSLCELEISLQGVKLIMSLEDEYDTLDEVWAGIFTQIYIKSLASFIFFFFSPQYNRCSHFFQMKNISFCGCHPRNNW